MAIRATAVGQGMERVTALPNLSSYSVCGWHRLEADNNAFATAWTIENANFEGIGTATDGTSLEFFSNANTISIGALTLNQWFWWGITRSGTAINVYYMPSPGSAIQTFSATIATMGGASTSWMNWMNDHSKTSLFQGRGANFKWWDAVLTADEIKNEANVVRPNRTANLAMWCPMNRGTVSFCAVDFSGNGRIWSVTAGLSLEDGPPVGWGGLSVIDATTIASDASTTITGVHATGASGTLAFTTTADVNLTGVHASGQAGTLSATSAASVSPTGVQGTGQVGTPSLTTSADLTLSGVSGTGSAGTLAIATAVDVLVNGVQGIGQVGTATATSAPTVVLTGVQAIGQIGTITAAVNADAAINGTAGTGQVGTPTVTTTADVLLTGVQATGQVGDLSVAVTGDIAVSITGVDGTGQVGTVTAANDQSVAPLDGVSFGGRNFIDIDRTTKTSAVITLRSVEANGAIGPVLVSAENQQPSITPVTREMIEAVNPTVRLVARTDGYVTLHGVYSMLAEFRTGQLGAPTPVHDVELEEFALMAAAGGY